MADQPPYPRTLRIDPDAIDDEQLRPAADWLRAGGLVAFPTETVYGLGANALDAAAVRRVFSAKGRPADNPIIVHAPDAATAWRVTTGPTDLAARLARRFWPGPLTLVLPASDVLPRDVTAGLSSVAVRVPDHPVALALLRLAAVPVAAPSANRSGRPSPTTAAHVLDDLGDAVDLVVDGGACAVGLESTVVDARGEVPVVLREGAITREDLMAALGPGNTPDVADTADVAGVGAVGRLPDAADGADAADVVGRPARPGAPADRLPDLAASPGTRHRHYAPACRVHLAPPGEAGALAATLVGTRTLAGTGTALGTAPGGTGTAPAAGGVPRVGIIARSPAPDGVLGIARFRDAADLAARLYAALRAAEAAGVSDLVVESVPETGIGRAVMDRLRRAAAAPTHGITVDSSDDAGAAG